MSFVPYMVLRLLSLSFVDHGIASSILCSGLRAWHKKNGLDYIRQEDPDIFAMMEIKCKEDQLPKDVANFEGYHKYWLSGAGEGSKEGYAGIG